MTDAPIKVAIAGIAGKMGSTLAATIDGVDDMVVVCGIDPAATTSDVPVYESAAEALNRHEVDVYVDFTNPAVVAASITEPLSRGIDCVVGTTGLTEEELEGLIQVAPARTCLFVAPNFTIGAVLLMEFSKRCAAFFPDAEVIEFHHCSKADAPSGTALRTAHLIAEAKAQPSSARGHESEVAGGEGARGAIVEGVPVHSVRSDGFVASQEVIFGSLGQTLTLRHDSWDRASYMPGVLLAIRSVSAREGLIVGLETLLDGVQR